MDGARLVASASAPQGTPAKIQIPSPKLWHPDTPFLYGLNVTIGGDGVRSYFGMRSVGLGTTNAPGSPDTGPQKGIDRVGSDMPGQPTTLPTADPNLCWNKCKSTSGCDTWAYGVPNCRANEAQPLCWLKTGFPGTSSDNCRVSGTLQQPRHNVVRPTINGNFTFLVGWLDQSWWPDGQYTAPTDAALQFDLQAVKTFGMNTVRLHQKVNSERWYYHADRLGVVVLQDMIQKFGATNSQTIDYFKSDLTAMIKGRYNHPSIIQWDTFNEGDCVGAFNPAEIVQLARQLDSSRLVDTNSGGPANDLHIGDVNDWHTYAYPKLPSQSSNQYLMVGEFGGIGAFISGKEWVPGGCWTYLKVNGASDLANTYIQMANSIQALSDNLSASIYTQITDLEEECDGFFTYDRVNKFTAQQTAAIAAANRAIIGK